MVEKLGGLGVYHSPQRQRYHGQDLPERGAQVLVAGVAKDMVELEL